MPQPGPVGTLPVVDCPRCGHENEGGARFCSACGAAIPVDDDSTVSLEALEDRQSLEEELGDLLAEVPAGTGVLVARRGPNAGSTFVLAADSTAIGRHPASDIFLDDVTVSRRHAVIRRTAGGDYVIADVGSLNGTYVDHERVDTAGLRDLAELQIGRFVLTFILGRAEAHA